MLDLVMIRKNPEEVAAKLARKGLVIDFTEFLAADEERRALIFQNEQLKAERNKTSAEIPKLKRRGEDTSSLMERMRQVGEEIRINDEKLAEMQAEQNDFLAALPNLPGDEVPSGGKENNQVVAVYGEKPIFDFEPKHHVDLVTELGLIDYPRGAKLGGSGFWVYRGDGARLEWALLNYFMTQHLADGYEMLLLPHILNYECGFTAGQFPKFAEDVFHLDSDFAAAGKDFSFLLPTAETALVNLHRDEILDEDELPLKYFAYTPCYRREAGSHGANERGMIRGHQFNKVEIFQYARPDQAEAALKELVGKAENLVKGLGLHFRTSRLAAEDCSASMRRTLDIEIWIPSMDGYKEVSSASDAGDYQARRGNIRYRSSESGKPEFVHTLNASGLATSRVFPAIIEQMQTADGSVVIPEVLRPWMGGQEIISRK
ncbi:MAG: serine--tRNA ligase [Saccharofermentanales bacterium]|jgi:seryl-tRNA synthetase|nr:serine--tRNA ligase [Bacillota bacterium]